MLNNERPGNSLPPINDVHIRTTIDRESMLYSYANTVASSYAGDVRVYVAKFGEYLESKAAYYDPKKNEMISFPIRYAAPNLVFSDNKGATGNADETSIKDRIVLPVMSYYLVGFEYDNKRAVDPCVRHTYKPDTKDPSRVWVTTSPKAMKYSFQVDVWTESRESFYQILTAFQLDFNPYSYLTDLHDKFDETQKTNYIPYVKMTLDSFSDNSNFIPGTERRIVRGTLKISAEGWLTQPPKNMPYVFRTGISIEGQAYSSDGIINSSKGWTSSSGTNANPSQGNTSLVDSVFNRTGDIEAEIGDYTAQEVVLQDSISGLGIAGDSIQDTLENVADKIAKDTFSIRLAQPMASGSLFRIINNMAYGVKSIDSIVPFVDGIVLANGNTGDIVLAGRKTNTEYATALSWSSDSTLYLSKTGTPTEVPPDFASGDKYALIVGRALSGTSSFIFDPSTPVKLA